eukprot:scaffold5523_cov58-Phaeocystis_antarctica.AAC.4
MLDIAVGFFIGLIVIISFTGLVFLYPLTSRATVSQGHVALPTAQDEDGAPEVAIKDRMDGDHTFDYVEAVLITVKTAKELRLRAEAMARVHSEQPHPHLLNLHPHLRLHTPGAAAAHRRRPSEPPSRPTARPLIAGPPPPRAQAG